MRLILVEDDYLQSDLIVSLLKENLPAANIQLIETELGFREQLAFLEKNPPDIFLIDIMLRWTDPSPNIQPAPSEVLEEGFYLAGLRCQKLMADSIVLSKTPVIFYTVLDRIDLEEKLKNLPSHITHIAKDRDISILIGSIKRILLL